LDILGYLKKFPDLKVTYRVQKTERPPTLYAFVDESYNDCPSSGKSTFGYILFLDGNPIHWKSKLMPFVTTGTPSTAYVAMNRATQEINFCNELLDAMGYPRLAPTTIFSDNQTAVNNVKTRNVTGLSKTMRANYHYVRDQCESGYIYPVWIPTGKNIADIFTKPLQAQKFTPFRDAIFSGAAKPPQ
jgi:hypothetical protein